jgi:hypothetical protein
MSQTAERSRKQRSHDVPEVKTPTDPDAKVKAYCWCDRQEVTVTIREVRAHVTRSCGRDDCRP